MALIFLLSSRSSLPTGPLFPGADLLAHAAAYGVLCMFLALSFVPPFVMNWRQVLLLTILVTAYGVTDEYHQSFVPGRDASLLDVLADGTGGFIVAWIMHWRYRRAVKIA
ncbi:MAG: VanZ family protein [Pseudomonadota bacterium]